MHDFAVGKLKRVIIEAPPGHGKSEACSRMLPAFLYGINPDNRVIACSYTKDLASEMNRDVQKIMDSPAYQSLFANVRLGASSVREDTMGKPRRNSDIFDIAGHRGYYKSAGVGSGIGGRRFDRGIIDDPIKDRQEANSSTHRERVWRWFTSTFMTRESRDAGILITSTRWHEDDLVGRIKKKMAEGTTEPWTVITLQAIATDKRHYLDPREPGEALWPWFRSVAKLEEIRRLEPRDFYALQQQEPRAEGSTEWDATLFPESIWFDEWPDELTILTIALDPSKGKDARHNDYSAFIAMGRDRAGTLWIEADMSRRNTTRIVTEGLDFCRRIQRETKKTLDGFGCESNQFQELLADEFIKISASKGIMIPVYKIMNYLSKDTRIRRLTPYFTGGNVRFRNTPGTRLLVDQLKQYPYAEHDDGPDAMEMSIRLAMELWNGNGGQ